MGKIGRLFSRRLQRLAQATLLGSILFGCGFSSIADELTKQYITVHIQGVFVYPEEYSGQYQPISHTYSVEEIYLLDAEGNKVQMLTEAPTSVIVDRRLQVVAKKEIDGETRGKQFASFHFVVNPSAKAKGLLRNYTMTLEDPDISYDAEFTVTSQLNVNFYVEVNWRGTIARNASETAEAAQNADYNVDLSVE